MQKEKKEEVNKELQSWLNSISELNGLKAAEGKVIVGTNISSVKDFMDLISLIGRHQGSAGIGLSINLSENLYSQIKNLSVNIQGKSNVERHLANTGKKSKRSKYHIKDDKYYDQLHKFSFMKPVRDKTAVTEEEQNTKYREFAAYANFSLSNNINNTVYGRNEYYITMEGFTDLATLMYQRGFYIRIKQSTLSYLEFLQNNFETIYT